MSRDEAGRRSRRAALRARRARAGRRRRLSCVTAGGTSTGRHLSKAEIDLAMMRRALHLAERAASMDEVPVGAVIYRGGRIVAEGFNNRESSRDPTGHAELVAISRAGRQLRRWRLADCSLAVTLEPCAMCAGAIVNARIERLVYGASDPKAGACESLYSIPTDRRLNHRVEVVGGVLAAECSQVLSEFFAKKRERNARARAQSKS